MDFTKHGILFIGDPSDPSTSNGGYEAIPEVTPHQLYMINPQGDRRPMGIYKIVNDKLIIKAAYTEGMLSFRRHIMPSDFKGGEVERLTRKKQTASKKKKTGPR